jgi:hypothetical protein
LKKTPQTTSGRKVTRGERKKKVEKNAVNSGHYALHATPKGSIHTSFGPTFVLVYFGSDIWYAGGERLG